MAVKDRSRNLRPDAQQVADWPGWLRRIVSLFLIFHLMAMLAIALAARPSSPLQRELATPFAWYAELTNLGQAHRYYAPAPPPTPIAIAELLDADGRTIATRRLPDRSIKPRLRYQRALALAFHLYQDHRAAVDAGAPAGSSVWGRSYARHLLAQHPQAARVRLRVQQHLIPDLVRVRTQVGTETFDPDDPRFFTVPELVIEYPSPSPANDRDDDREMTRGTSLPPLPSGPGALRP